MGKIKQYFEERIVTLAELTGYNFGFLMDRWLEVCEDDGDWNYFVGVTLEQDW